MPKASMLRIHPDVRLLIGARVLRMFAYGALSVVLVLYLSGLGFDGLAIGILLSLTLVGDAGLSLLLTTRADRLGRRPVLIAGAVLMAASGLVFVATSNYLILVLAATVGVLSPSAYEVGPFLAVEQASLSQVVSDDRRTAAFGWYNLAGSLAVGAGALCSGTLAAMLSSRGWSEFDAYRIVFLVYSALAITLVAVFLRLSQRIEVVAPRQAGRLGLRRSKQTVLRLSTLFGLDSFAGGLVMQSLLAYWLHLTYGLDAGAIGAVLFAANVLAALSAPISALIASRVGLPNTIVFSQVPANVLLMLVPLMPTVQLAVAVLLARFAVSQMDIPTRQSLTMALVDPDERSAASGLTGIARTAGAAISPNLAGPLMTTPGLGWICFAIAGSLKLAYVTAFWAWFRTREPGALEGSSTPG